MRSTLMSGRTGIFRVSVRRGGLAPAPRAPPQTYAQHQINQYKNKHTHAHTHADIPKYASTAASNLPAAASRWKRAVSFVAPVSSTNSATEVSDTSILTPPPQSALPPPLPPLLPNPPTTRHSDTMHTRAVAAAPLSLACSLPARARRCCQMRVSCLRSPRLSRPSRLSSSRLVRPRPGRARAARARGVVDT